MLKFAEYVLVRIETMSEAVSEQAKRLKKIRLYLGMTRDEFSKVIASSQFTIRSWENGHKQFGEKAVKKVINELTKIGFKCSFDWIMHGKGVSPISLYEASAAGTTASMSVRENAVESPLMSEIHAIRAAFPGMDIINVSDTSYLPLAQVGDLLGFREIPADRLIQWQDHIVFYITRAGGKGFGTVKIHDQITVQPFDRSSPLSSKEVQNLHEIVWYRKVEPD